MPLFVAPLPPPDAPTVKTKANYRLRHMLEPWIEDTWLDAPPSGREQPQARLVEHNPHYDSRPHFHTVDQFQLTLAGSGTIGKHALRAGSAHYADAYSPYGPIHGESRGLVYLTLRNRVDTGANYMPESREKRKPVTPRQHVFDVDVDRRESGTVVAFEDGLAVARRCEGPEAVFELAVPQGCGGLFGVVLAGEVAVRGRSCGEWSCFFLGRGDVAGDLRAGPRGLDLLLLQFPIPRND